MRMFAFAIALVLFGCHDAGSAYDEPLPGRRDAKAYSEIATRLKPEDRSAWTSIATRQTNPLAAPVRSATVGEAIGRWKAQRACLELHASRQDAAGADVKARNREIDAYNDCLEMEL